MIWLSFCLTKAMLRSTLYGNLRNLYQSMSIETEYDGYGSKMQKTI